MQEDVRAALDRIHKGDLIVLREIDRVCKKHKINFVIDSGTLLGAVRHKSAIPWDDDADVAMLRSDFEKFRRIAAKELKPEFQYVEPDELGNAVFDFVARVVLIDSTIRPDSEEEQYYGSGICNRLAVDIFVIDDVSDSDLVHTLCRGLLTIVYGMGMGHRYRLNREDYTPAAWAVIRVLSAIGKHIPARTIVHWYEAVSRLETGKNKQKHRVYYGNYLFGDIKQIYQKEWFVPTVEVTLDGETFPGPRNWHMCLETQYGDYMKLPPKEKQVPNHMQPQYVQVHHPDMDRPEDKNA